MAEAVLVQRRNYYIKKEFQNAFILQFCILMVFACFGFGFLLYMLSQSSVTTAFQDSRLVVKSTADYILPFLGLTGFLVIIAVGIATISTVKKMSHAIAGPLYRLEKHLQGIGRGDFSQKVTLRHSDQLQKTADELNDMIEKVAHRLHKVRRDVDVLEQSLSGQDHDLVLRVRQIKEDLSYFHTGHTH